MHHIQTRPDRTGRKEELTEVTKSAFPAVGTDALEGVQTVNARSSTATGATVTVVDVWVGDRGE